MKNLVTRTLSGAVYVVLIIAGICISPATFIILGCLLTGLGINEFRHLAGQTRHATLVADLAVGLTLFGGFATIASCGFMPEVAALWGAIVTACLAVRLVMQLYIRGDESLKSLSVSAMAQLYVALPIALTAVIYSSENGAALLLAVFIMLWVNDTGAYLVGSSIGRRRLFERLSPKKSWEGFFGGVAFAIGSAFVFYYCFPAWYAIRPLWFYITLGAAVSVFGTWGDLAESMLKRAVGVKDSGNLIPGHGGILDRIDSLLLAAPATVILLAISVLI